MNFTKSVIQTLSGNLLTGIFSMLVAIYFARALGAEGKGIVAQLVIISSLLALTSDFGISISNIYFSRSLRIPTVILFSNSLLWAMLVGTGVGIGFYEVSQFIGYFIDNALIIKAVLVASVLVPMYLFLGLQRNLLLGVNEVLKYNLSNAFQPLLVLFFSFGIFHIVKVSPFNAMISYLFSLIVLCIIVVKFLKITKLRLDFSVLWSSIKFGFLGHLGTLVQYGNYRFDVLLLGMLSSNYAVGIYSVSYSCAEILWRFPRSIGTILFPKVAGIERSDADRITRLVFKLSNIVLLLGGLLAGAIGYRIIPLVFGEDFRSAVLPFLVLLPGVFFFSWNNILIEDLKGRGFPKFKTYTATLSLIITVALDVYLIPKYEALGAAFVSTIAYSFSGFFSLFLFCKKTKKRYLDMILIFPSDIVYGMSVIRSKFWKYGSIKGC